MFWKNAENSRITEVVCYGVQVCKISKHGWIIPLKSCNLLWKPQLPQKHWMQICKKSFLILLKLTRIIIREAPKKWCVNISLYFIVSFSCHYYYFLFFLKKFNNNEKVVVVSRKNIYELVFVRRRRRSIREFIYKDKDK